MKKDIRIALIVLEDEESQFYQNLLSGYGDVTIEPHSTIQQFKSSCQGKCYSGFIVDMQTLIRSSTQEKEFFASLHEGFPVMQVRRSPEEDTVSCLVKGKQLGDLRGEQLLDHFINQDCWQKAPREVRVLPRKNIFLNTKLYLSEKARPVRTNLWDISEGGCFVLSTHEKKKGESVWLMINELSNNNRIRGQIRWAKLWGTAPDHLPGFGISFEEITGEQRNEIQKTLES